MCYHHEEAWSRESLWRPEGRSAVVDNALMTDLRLQLAETEGRLARARAREAELSRRLQEMRRFASVMEILESYLRRCTRRSKNSSLSSVPLFAVESSKESANAGETTIDSAVLSDARLDNPDAYGGSKKKKQKTLKLL